MALLVNVHEDRHKYKWYPRCDKENSKIMYVRCHDKYLHRQKIGTSGIFYVKIDFSQNHLQERYPVYSASTYLSKCKNYVLFGMLVPHLMEYNAAL